MIKDKFNTPDGSYFSAEGFSSFESAYWQMLIHRESQCSADKEQDDFERYDIEHLFKVWNERFGTQLKPRWKD